MPPGVTPEQLAEWERLAAEATPRPWHRVYVNEWEAAGPAKFDKPRFDPAGERQTETDADFTAAARDALPLLIAEIRRLTAERDRLVAEARAEGWREGVADSIEMLESEKEDLATMPTASAFDMAIGSVRALLTVEAMRLGKPSP